MRYKREFEPRELTSGYRRPWIILNIKSYGDRSRQRITRLLDNSRISDEVDLAVQTVTSDSKHFIKAGKEHLEPNKIKLILGSNQVGPSHRWSPPPIDIRSPKGVQCVTVLLGGNRISDGVIGVMVGEKERVCHQSFHSLDDQIKQQLLLLH
ncbi:hypothetical protein EVAR_96920_1 [Eumeta japonica]|uniref:Uncharacterized protein n=1 Tax=Eumeta variegata TaxID=151549 RepID=A0A4C1WEV4_EUMVA|nr:hypothetical protein EVAR_96920_1 [Eumeta japonica]